MISREEIVKLAELSRVALSAKEQERAAKDIDAIVAYVSDITEISTKAPLHSKECINVLREDANPHESGIYTKELLSAAPAVMRDFIKVKKIIAQD